MAKRKITLKQKRDRLLKAAHRGSFLRKTQLFFPLVGLEILFALHKFPALIFGETHHTFLRHADRKRNGRIVNSYAAHRRHENFARASTAVLVIFAMTLILFGYFWRGQPAHATETFTVNSGDDVDDGTCDGTHCSFREALNAANASLDTSKVISFNIPQSDPSFHAGTDTVAGTDDDFWQIDLPVPLTTIQADGIFINGKSQTDNAGDAQPEILLSYAGTDPADFHIYASNVEITGLALNNFTTFGFTVGNATQSVSNINIHDNYIGTNVYGTAAQSSPSGFPGISLYSNTPVNTISNVTIANNLISGNGVGVEVIQTPGGGDISSVAIQDNRIGTAADGTTAISNSGNGISLDGSGVTSATITGNQIAGNLGYGISIINGASGAVVTNNLIGVVPAADTILGNGGGVQLATGAHDNTIGSTVADNHNVISGSIGAGVILSDSTTTANTIIGNFIGSNRSGNDATAVIANNYGVRITSGAHDNMIGGSNDTVGCSTGPCNVIAGNTTADVLIEDSNSNTVAGNFIGTTNSGSRPLSFTTEATRAVEISGTASGNVIGGNNNHATTEFEYGNLISGYGMGDHPASIAIDDSTSSNAVYGNFIGTSPSGAAPDNYNNTTGAAGSDGVNDLRHDVAILVLGTGNTVGAGAFSDLNTATYKGNLISGNGTAVVTQAMKAGAIAGNLIGTNALGTAAVGNGGGIFYMGCPAVSDADCTTAGNTQISGNLISGTSTDPENPSNLFAGMGITLGDIDTDFAADHLTITGNAIGTNVSGTAALANRHGIFTVNSVGVVIDSNLISGNTNNGFEISPFGASLVSGLQITNNKFGTNTSGSAALANGDTGITVRSPATDFLIRGNVISGNQHTGLAIGGGTGHVVQSNKIGVGQDGTTAVANSNGITVSDLTTVTIGGAAESDGNIIAGNDRTGLLVTSVDTATVRNNKFGVTGSGGSLPNGSGGARFINGASLTVSDNVVGNNLSDSDVLYTGTAVPLQRSGQQYTDILAGFGSCVSGKGLNVVYLPDAYHVSRGVICNDGQVFAGVDGGYDLNVSVITSGSNHYTILWSPTDLSALGLGTVDCALIKNIAGSGGTCDATQTLFTKSSLGGAYTRASFTSGLSVATGFTATPALTNNTVTDAGIVAIGTSGTGNVFTANTFTANQNAGLQLINTNNVTVDSDTFQNQSDTTADTGGGATQTGYLISRHPLAIDGQKYDQIIGYGTTGLNYLFAGGTSGYITTAGGNLVESYAGTNNIDVALVDMTISGTTFHFTEYFDSLLFAQIGQPENCTGVETLYGMIPLPPGTTTTCKAFKTNYFTANGGTPNDYTFNGLSGFTIVGGGTVGLASGYDAGTPSMVYSEIAPVAPGVAVPDGQGLIVAGGSNIALTNLTSTNNAADAGIVIADANTVSLTASSVTGNKKGIVVSDGTAVTIGGAGAARVQVTGNSDDGVTFDATASTITGSYIGVQTNGTTAAANTGNGIVLSGSGNTISNNVVGANQGSGIVVISNGSTTDNTIQGNMIGVNGAGTTALANAGNGIALAGDGSNAVINNTISGHTSNNGILLTGSSNRIQGNKIGTNSAGSAAIANTIGISATSGSGNLIGTNGDGVSDDAEANVIAGNSAAGLSLTGSANANTIAGNFIGTTSDGTTALPNQIGVGVSGVSSTMIGGCTSARGNLISSNTQANIAILGAGSDATTIASNRIGSNAAGTAVLGSNSTNILLQGSAADPIAQTTIGGCGGTPSNIIVGAGAAGVLSYNTIDTTIEGNYIGLGSDSATALPNSAGVVSINGANLTVGNTGADQGNVIGNNGFGVLASGNGVAVKGNTIGTGPLGTEDFGNTGMSVIVYGNSTNSAIDNNVIANHRSSTLPAFYMSKAPLAYQGTNFDNLISGGIATALDCGAVTSGAYFYDMNGVLSSVCGDHTMLPRDFSLDGTTDVSVSLLRIDPPAVPSAKYLTIYHLATTSCTDINNQIFAGAGSCVATQDAIFAAQGATSSYAFHITNPDMQLLSGATSPAELAYDQGNAAALGIFNVVGGEVRNNTIRNNNASGVVLSASSDHQLTGNTIENNALQGIALINGTTDTIVGSQSSANAITHNGASGVLIAGAATQGNTITANNLSQNTLSGVSSQLTHGTAVLGATGGDNTISSNVISQNSANGIYNRGASPVIASNTIISNGDNGIVNFVDFGANADPATAGDDTVSVPVIGGTNAHNTITNNNNIGVYSLDTAPKNAATLGGDNTFGSNGALAAKQDWYGLVYVTEDNQAKNDSTVKIYTQEGATPIQTFTTGSNGVGPTTADLTDVGSWMTITAFDITNTGVRQDYSPHTVIATGSSGSSNYDFGSAFADLANGTTPTPAPADIPGITANINGRYQVASVSLSILPGKVSGAVFNDANNNAARDGGEDGVQNARVILYQDKNNDGVLQTNSDLEIGRTSTDSSGNYQFTNLISGKYIVSFDSSSLGDTAIATTTNPVGPLDLTAEGATGTANFGVRFTAPQVLVKISGTVFNDNNQNQTNDDGEGKVANAKIFVYGDANGNNKLDLVGDDQITNTLSATDGSYTFTNLVAGTYFVYLDSSVLRKDQHLTTNNPSTALVLNATDQAAVVNFGIYTNTSDVPVTILPVIPGGKFPGPGPSIIAPITGKIPPVVFGKIQGFTRSVAAPLAVAVGAVNLLAAVTPNKWAPFARFLFDFFSEPFLMLFGRRKLPWGRVFNSLNKQPLDLTFVRLYSKDGQLIRTTVTDRTGRFRFAPAAGAYAIKASKTHFAFPSSLLSGIPLVEKSRLYLGGVFSIDEKHPSFTKDIPLDPPQSSTTSKELLRLRLRQQAHLFVAYFGIVVSFVNMLIIFSPLTYGLFVVHIVLLLVFWRLAYMRKPKPWGRVYDATTHKPVKGALVRIYDQRFGRLLETKITNARGEYGFLVGPSTYYLTVEAPGYSFPADKDRRNDYVGGPVLIRADEPQVNYDIPLKK